MKNPFFIRKSFFVLLAPLFMAVLCEKQEDIACGFEDFEGFGITVENTQTSYDIDETIWLDATASSMLENSCDNGVMEIASDSGLFRDSLFILKLVDSDTEINSQVTNSTVMYDVGAAFGFDACDEAVNVTPVQSSDTQSYTYRLGFSFDTPGDYAIVLGRHTLTTINNSNNVNLDIYDAYSNSNNTIKYNSCDATFTRTLNTGVYFFSVQ